MNLKTVRALDAINRIFYNDTAEDFDATRSAPWDGWEQLLSLLSCEESAVSGQNTPTTLRVLDIGCGNGRFARFLTDHTTRIVQYIGLDTSQPLLAYARSILPPPQSQFEWKEWNFLADTFPPTIASQAFDLIVLFGVIHHVPSFELRRRLLERTTALLAPNGILALAFWRFHEEARFRRRILPWEKLIKLDLPELPIVDQDQLEPGDTLLAWGKKGGELRYCHAVDAREEQRLLLELPLAPLADYYADGREGHLNHYRILHRVENTSIETGIHHA